MTEGHTMLQPLLAHLFGPTLGTAIAEMARATEGERVAIVGTDATVPGDLHRQPIPGMNDETLAGHSADLHDPFPVIEFITWNPPVCLEGLTPPCDLMVGLPPQCIDDE